MRRSPAAPASSPSIWRSLRARAGAGGGPAGRRGAAVTTRQLGGEADVVSVTGHRVATAIGECLTELLGATDFGLTVRGQDCCHTHTGFAGSQQSHSHDSTHPKHQTHRSIPRRARLRLSGRGVAHDGPRGADALACDGGRGPSRGHPRAEEAARCGQSLDPVVADAPPPTEQGPEPARRTEPSSAATRPRLLCAGAAAT
jgi:hypothetical protein